jgi:alanyl-tRNA synthetase
VTSAEIRELFLSFFEGRDHRRLRSGSLVPATYDPTVLLTTAGMQPLKPYFMGLEDPPHRRLTSAQKCFRAVDIDNIGLTTRHLTFFEMLGNFSVGDYFKQGAAEFAWDLSTNGLGFDPESVWVTVHEGDATLGLGPDEETIAIWEAIGVPRSRIALLPSSDNFWQAGPTGPCGPCSELYLDRGPDWGGEDERPGSDGERFLEFWNLVFMQYEQGVDADGRPTLTPLPQQNIDTGLGLERQALIQQGVDSIFDTDQFLPLMGLGRELASVAEPDERALRILADHTRGMTFLIADGVVPSNEDRGFVLRRLMRRAIQQGHRIGIEGAFLPRYVDAVVEVMGAAYPEIVTERDTILKWVRAEEEAFGRTLEHGLQLLERLLDAGEVSGDDAFRLHDTYGFPIDLTEEIAGERGATVDRSGFEALMGQQRSRSSAAARFGRVGVDAEAIRDLGAPTAFVGYDRLAEEARVEGVADAGDGRQLVKLAASPFYAQGGGQVADTGTLGDGRVVDVLRAGEDQALVVEGATLEPGAKVRAAVDRDARQRTQRNHTATHLLHAALREALGTHVRQAGSYVGPDKLRFDFTHGQRLSPEELRAVEDRVNEWIGRNEVVSWRVLPIDEARAAGAMALFGEKYGDEVRMVEIGDGSWSRELCGGTHVAGTGEIGVFKITSEGSSASNVRRIEALTGPAAVELLRDVDREAREAAAALRAPVEELGARVTELQAQLKAARKGGNGAAAVDLDALVAQAVDGVLVAEVAGGGDAKALVAVADRARNALGDAAVVLGSAGEGKVALVAAVAPALVARGVKAGAVVRTAAQVAGGGGGGKDTMAQAGGKDPEKLGEALDAARTAITEALGS